MLLVLAMSGTTRRALIVAFWLSGIWTLVACGSDGAEQAQVVSVTPTPVATTPPLTVPTSTAVPTPTPAPLPGSESAPSPTATNAEIASPTPTVAPQPSPTPAPASPDPTPTAEVTATPTVPPTPTAEPEPEGDASDGGEDPDLAEPTSVAETPTAVVASSEPPVECYDRDAEVPRAFVEGVDTLSFEGGRVYCAAAGTSTTSVARSYRHATGLFVQRNGDFLLNDAGTGYIPYSGSLHFCLDGLAASTPVRADTLLGLFAVIDSEAQRQLDQGASRPTAFTAGGAQC